MRVSPLWTLTLILALAACSQAPIASESATPTPPVEATPPAPETPAPPPAEAKNEPVMCSDPRPEMCTAIYQPVCATRDTGIRCITTPCPSTEEKTMGNACSACSDKKVISYVKGECPAK